MDTLEKSKRKHKNKGTNYLRGLLRFCRTALFVPLLVFGLIFSSCQKYVPQDVGTPIASTTLIRISSTPTIATTITPLVTNITSIRTSGTPTMTATIIPLAIGTTSIRTNSPPTVTATVSPLAVNTTYYVDSILGRDENNCLLAQNPSTPKKTVSGVMSCEPGPGETVRFKGVFKETIIPTRSGTVVYDVQDIVEVNGSVVTFNQPIANIYPPTDYVTIYGSRKGNSGAFAIISASGNRVTVDTSDLPAGKFLPEAATDPGSLQAAILRPVRFTAWDLDNPPVWDGDNQTYHSINQSVIMLSHIKSISGWPRTNAIIWPAVEIDGNNSGNSDFQIFDHLEIVNAESAIAVENGEFHSNYNIIQFNNLHDTGYVGDVSDEVIYFGQAYHPERHHDFVQIMYNKVGPHKKGTPILGDGIEIKPSAHYASIFGNEIVGIQPNGCSDAPIKIAGTNAFIANNYVHDITPQASQGCGISIVDEEPIDPTSGGGGAIVINNIVANVKGVGIKVIDASGVQILNNTVYNIFPEPNCDTWCMEDNMGIEVHNWQGPLENMVIKNNIVQKAHIGIGRYIGSHDEYPISIDSDFNIVFDTDFAFRGTIINNTHDLVMDPGLVDPENYNFSLMAGSPGRDSGTNLTSVFSIDNHDAADPTLPTFTAPIIRTGIWDRGAYEYK
jgi:hypothetical protein